MNVPPRTGAATLRDYKARVLRVLVFIQAHLDEPLSLSDLAALACFSPYHFHRVFRGMVGESVKEHVRRLRLERAASQLRLGNRSIIRIALDAGYRSHEAFTRSFKAAFGVAPARYRALRRPPPPPAASGVGSAPSGVHYGTAQPLSRFTAVPPGNLRRCPITVKHCPALRVAFVRHVGPYSQCGAAWDRLLTYLGKEGWLGGESRFIGLSHDDPEITPPSRIRYDACVTAGDGFEPQGDIGVQVIAGGDYAMATHFGPYTRLGHTYARIMGQWLPRSGRELGDGPCYEIYLNDPNSTAPEDLVTDVYVPLRPAIEARPSNLNPSCRP